MGVLTLILVVYSGVHGGTQSGVHGGTQAGVHGGTQSGVHGGTQSGVHGGTPLRTCVTKPACSSLGVRQLLHLNDFRLLMSGDNHLGDALAVVDDEVLLR